MTELSGSQKSYLRGLGQNLKPTLVIGKAGLSEGVAEGLNQLLDRHELVKVRLPADAPDARREMAAELARLSRGELVGLIGRNALLYRKSEMLDPKRQIVLP